MGCTAGYTLLRHRKQ